MVRKRGISPVIIHRQSCFVLVPSELILYQVLFELRISRKKYPIAPSRDSHFLGSVIHLTIVIILVSRVEVQLALLELAQDHIAWFYSE